VALSDFFSILPVKVLELYHLPDKRANKQCVIFSADAVTAQSKVWLEACGSFGFGLGVSCFSFQASSYSFRIADIPMTNLKRET
jgi:hypothetical protein